MSAAVLVTGGAGFIGSHLVDQLIAQGRHVVVLDDLSTGSRDNLATAMETGRLRLVEGSILSQDAVAAAMRDVQLVFHLAVQLAGTNIQCRCMHICWKGRLMWNLRKAEHIFSKRVMLFLKL